MNTSKTEFLSALLDDEAGEFERRRLLDELRKDDELGNTLSRYALIGETMRAGNAQRSSQGISLLGRIQDELVDEPAYDQPAVQVPVRKQAAMTSSRMGWGVAMAATVAALAMGGMLFMQQPTRTAEQVAAAPVPVSAPQAVAALPANGQTAVASATNVDDRIRQIGRVDSQTRDILKQYVAQHVKYASTTAIAPSIRAVSYGNER
ncbi:MAG TPA: sigma-E factor negative regulatory protein [Candidatus Thiothrix moscowensis]|uniref:sigma-E factor negative regulatory protein n=1 Tax=unclassified Thiothrix TaxID=2636184 RepID=UPI0025CEA1EB|nr:MULTISPECIES: sigma-E factor negative regulatory protein [unclassified Thiothrix]HRJ52113.1 sigma-E factor negative regulatory protein [Candidatus Thiothrix moscowensis]HRJ92376.1 sigma-E factor negative regulatory protein [Candidatus Thiothrix moscowensis]